MRIVLAFSLCLAASCSPPGPGDLPAKDRVVVLISLSGFPAVHLQDPDAPIPTLRRLIGEGAAAAAMTPGDPTVSWPNHSTLSTGVRSAAHGVIYNGLLQRGGSGAGVRVKPCGRAELLRAKTFYDAARDAGFSTAQVGWVPGQADGSITWGFGEAPDPKNPIEREMVQAGTLTNADMEEVGKTSSPNRDDVWFRVARHVIREHRPSVLLVRLTDLDATIHKVGPSAPEARAVLSAIDGRVAGILDELDKAGLRQRATVFIVSDQGFKTVRRHIRPNAALREAGLLSAEGPKFAPQLSHAEAHAITAGGTCSVFVTDPERREEIKERARKVLSALEGVERVADPARERVPGYPRENPQTGDLVLQAKPGYGFISALDGKPVSDVTPGLTVAFHGYPSGDPDMDGIFIAWGRGIRQGARLPRIANVDVAPTIARVLGVRLDAAEGRVLSDILQ